MQMTPSLQKVNQKINKQTKKVYTDLVSGRAGCENFLQMNLVKQTKKRREESKGQRVSKEESGGGSGKVAAASCDNLSGGRVERMKKKVTAAGKRQLIKQLPVRGELKTE